jgi:RHS repeat-associated protein
MTANGILGSWLTARARITDTYTFDAFGAQIASTGTTPSPYLYSGERFDSSLNLYHLRERYYNMLTGRFETMDPNEGDILEPATLHKYVYAANDPVDSTDPSGEGTYAEYKVILWNRAYSIALHSAHHS